MIGKRVLIVVDQSPDAQQVLQEGFALCRQLGVTPAVMTTLPERRKPTASGSTEQQAQSLQRSLILQVRKLTSSADDVEIFTPTGDPAHEIRSAALAFNADLIVIGNHPETGLGLFLGSTANVVLHDAPCHVLTIALQKGESPDPT